MKKRGLSLFMVLVLCLTLLPTAAFAEGEDVSISGGVIGGGETGGEGGGIYVAPGSPTEGGGGTYIPGEDTRTEIRFVTKPYSIERSYDGTTDGSMVSFGTPEFTDGTNTFELTEGTDFTAKKTFDSADAGNHTVTVEITLIGNAATKYKLKSGEEKFEIRGAINKAYPELTVSLSQTTCTVGEKILPLLSVSGVQENAAVTYYYAPMNSGYLEFEGNEAVPAINENTAISEPGTYYVYAKSSATKNYEEERSETVELTVTEPVAASVTKADGTVSGTYKTLPAALNAAQDGDTVKLLANHTTNWYDVEAGEYDTLAVVKKALTLDLNGWTIDYLEVGEVVPDEEGGILESIDGNLTVVESSQGTTGKIIDLNFIKGTLDIQGGAIGADPSSTEGNSGQLTCNGNSGSVTIGGGTVYGVTVGDGASVIVSGGSMHEGNWFNDGTLTITGGTFDSVWFRNNGGTIAIRGGTFGEITNENASGKIPVMSLLADGYAFYGKDADEKYTVLQDSRETTLENVKVMDHTDHAFLNGACIACGALTCDKSNNGEEGGCIAHAVWSPWADDPTWGTTHIKTLDELRKKITDGGTYWSEMNPDAANATVTFLSDVTVDKTFLIDKYFAQIFLDLNGHTLSGELQEPIITANFSAGNPIIAIRNGTIENTGTGEAIRLEWGRVTLENVNVTGDMAIAYQYVNGSMYTAPFLGGGSFTRICPAANDVGGTWSKKLKDMLGTGCCFLDSAGSRIDAEQWFGSGGYSKIKELIDVRVKACDHKDENGSYTLFEDATMSYGSLAKRCKICGNLCPHDEITGDQNPACVACGLPIVIKTTNLLGGKDIGPWYYTGLNDAMHEILHVNKGRRPTLELLADTKSDSSYEWLTNDYDGIFIDLAGHTLTLTGDQNKASYWVTIQNTSDTHAEVRGTVNVYHKDNRSKLVILDTDNDLTIEEVKFVGDGTAQFAGGSFGKITVPAGKTLASLLVSGYYFADSNSATDEPAALYDTAGKALTVLTKVTVKPCSHDEAIYVPVDGGAWKCFCGQKTFVASVTKDDTTTLYTDLQEAFKAADGGTVELMANMVDVTVNTEKPFIFDLNGHSIHKLTVNSKITLKDSSEGEGKIVENLIVEAEGLTVGDLLEEGYAFRSCSDNSWYGETLKTVGNARVQQVPITSVTLDALNAKDNTDAPTTMVYGTTGGVKLSASCNILNLTTPDCKWYEVSGSLIPIDNAMGMNYFLPDDLIAGEHTYRVTFICDGYEKSAEITITVEKADLSEAEIEFPYGNEAVFNYLSATGVPTFVVKYNGKEMERDALIITGDTFDGVGPCMLTVKAAENSNYTGSKSADWTVRPLKITASGANVVKTYDGTADLPANASITFKSVDSMYTGVAFGLSKGTDYQLLDARYDSPNAGEEKTVSFTVKLLEEGYVFEDGTRETSLALKGSTVKINKADAPNTSSLWLEQHVFNELAKTYEIDLKTLLPGLSVFCEYGEITYGTPRVTFTDTAYQGGDATLTNGVLRLPIASANTSKSEIGTVTIEVNSTNYQTFELTLHVIADDKIVLDQTDVAVSASEITYGQTLADSKLTVTGKMKCPRTGNEIPGTFAWKDGTVIPDAGSYEAEWTFTPDEGYEEYAVATGTVKVKVKPAKLTVSVKASRAYYTGEAQIALIIASGQSVDSTPVTFTYSDKVDGNYTSDGPTFTDAGTYTAYYKAEAANHEPATGTFTVTIDPLPISLLSVTKISKAYDGSADVTLSANMLTFISKAAKTSNIKLPDTALSFSNAQFTKQQADGSYLPSPEVGGGKALSFTMTLTSDNYVFEGKSKGTTEVSDVFATDDVNRFTITKAAAPTMQPIELTVINGLAKTYLVNLPALPTLGDNCKYGSIKYEACNFDLIGEGGYANSTAMITSNDEFQLTVPAVESQTEGSVGTVGVKITTDNYQDMLLTVEVIAKNKIVPVLDGEITATPITFGQILRVSTITGTMKDNGKTVEGTFEWTNPSTKPDKAGDYQAEWTFTPAAGYEKYATATGTVTIKVNKATPTFTAPTAQENLTYTGQEQALITAGSVTSGGAMQYSLTENGTYSQDIPVGTDAGTYTVWYRVIGDANHNDTAPASVAVRIGQKRLTITGVTAASKPYDGTKKADISSVTFDGVNWNQGTDYTVTASFDDASAGNGKNITATVTLMGQTAKNYALEQSSFSATGSITKAAAPDFTKETALTIVNGHEKTYTVTLPALPTLETPKEYGALTYEIGEIKLNDGYYTSGAKVENGELTLPIQKNDVETTGSVGTVTVVIKSTNYADITLTVNVNATNKLVPTVTAPTANALTYNGAEQALVTAGKTTGGTMLYRLGDSEWSEQLPTAKNAGKYTVWYKVQGDAEYADVAEQSLTVTAVKKAVTVTALDKSAYTGSTAPDLSSPEADKNYKVEGLLGADTLSGTVTLTYEQTPDMSKPGKTAINIAGTLSNDNYEITYVSGTLTVSDRSSNGGGGSSSDRDTSSSGTVKTETTKNNDGSVTKTETKKDGTKVETTTGKDGSVTQTTTNPNGSSVTETKAADGSTGTVKTDKNGQTEASAKISDKAVSNAKNSGDAVKVPTEVRAGTNSNSAPTVKIELPRNSGETKVEIPVTNVKPGTVAVLVHADGTEEIVKNSVPTEDGIQLTVNGGATVKIVDNSKGFIDIRDHWAEDAIDFVSARGLVNGMSATIYAPNASTTRAQLWTILARQNDADLTGGATWFENAQNWAKEKGISDGTNPNGTINRAQMVTMLWRAVGQPVAGSTANFADVSADAYYASAVAWAVENGITTGVGNGKFDPNATCTRGQIATFLWRAMAE